MHAWRSCEHERRPRSLLAQATVAGNVTASRMILTYTGSGENAFLFIPNLVGYARVALLAASCYYMLSCVRRTLHVAHVEPSDLLRKNRPATPSSAAFTTCSAPSWMP